VKLKKKEGGSDGSVGGRKLKKPGEVCQKKNAHFLAECDGHSNVQGGAERRILSQWKGVHREMPGGEGKVSA